MTANRPTLKQFGDLRVPDFEEHGAWVGCHTADSEEPWYEETDEETFRPWSGALPVDASSGMFLVRTTITLADGSVHAGFATPSLEDNLGLVQPHIFVGSKMFGFWGGMFGVPPEGRRALYLALGRSPEAVFPATFAAAPGLTTGACSGIIEGFYRLPGKEPVIER